ncbi:bifunctional UDP-sugar hydrolase/5'-nucleotidase [Ignavigranum ruoffiae]|uniref:bifunctional metallophosphatase/5'-nucleotidase n=1 Tax=Ignavigranum ruoffiae TaxID=89093 RepID=UPI003B00AA30
MRFNIIHTNDLHGHLEHWPIIEEFIRRKKDQFQDAGEAYFIVDDGDAMDTVHPLVEATQGQIMVDLFNQSAYDVVTIGNNEGLNFTQEQLGQRYQQANFQVVIANLVNQTTLQTPEWAQPYLLKEVDQCRIAFLGVTAPYQTYQLNHYEIIDPLLAIKQTLVQIQQEGADIIILLSHLGLDVDREIAETFPEINLIIGGHTHHLLAQGEWANQSLLTGAGRYGDFIGEVTIEWDAKHHQADLVAQTYDIRHLADQFQIEIGQDPYFQQGQRALQQIKIATSPQNYLVMDTHSSESFIQLGLEAISWATDCPLAMLNTGLFLSDLAQGPISLKELHEALPHPMHLAKLRFTGKQLTELLYEVADQVEDLQYQMVNGLGFRGKVFGEVIFKGIEYHYPQDRWLVEGAYIDDDQIYHLVTVDHLWFLPFFPAIDQYGQPELIFPDFLRHVIANYLKHIYPSKDTE